MLTRCPRCLTVFSLTADDLKIAQGQVQCGRCAQLFDAARNLQQESQYPRAASVFGSSRKEAVAARSPPPRSVPKPAPAPDREMPGWAFDDLPEIEMRAEPRIAADVDTTDAASMPMSGHETESSSEAHAVALDFQELEREIESLRREEERVETAPAGTPQKPEDILLEDLPRVAVDRDDVELLRGYLAEAGGSYTKTSAWWGVGAAFLCVALLGQALWFERDRLFAKFPQTRSLWQRVCADWPCALPPQRDLHALRVLSRDVRDHPQYRDALLVNATLVNEAAFAQPYPVLELTLFDQTGQALGVRRFAPSEYLDGSIPLAAGMKSRQVVYVVLELAGIGDHAVSFEFKFL